jgi:methylamine dehydrogenase accessory protein MauD
VVNAAHYVVFDLALLAALAVIAAVTFRLAREIGRLQVKLGPLGARMMDNGPGPGDPGPHFPGLTDILGRNLDIGGPRERSQLLLFMSPNCSTCRSLLPGLRSLARSERDFEVVVVSDGTPAEHVAFLEGFDPGPDLAYCDAFEVGLAYAVGATPYGVALDRDGVVRAKGLCNHMQQVESLLNALELGVPSLQHLHRRGLALESR